MLDIITIRRDRAEGNGFYETRRVLIDPVGGGCSEHGL